MQGDFLPWITTLLALAFFVAAALYASVGHGGASAYLAVMGLCGVAPEEMKPVALVLNIAVSLVALAAFHRKGYFQSRLFWPLAAASVPAAFAGGALETPELAFKIILCGALLAGAWRLLAAPAQSSTAETRPVNIPTLLVLGAVIGFLSGLVGIGGGIFLTPALILLRWAPTKTAAAISAAFIAANSCSGLAGFMSNQGTVPAMAWWLLPCVLGGGLFGAIWGSGRAQSPALRRALCAVLIIAAAKFLIV